MIHTGSNIFSSVLVQSEGLKVNLSVGAGEEMSLLI